MTNKITVKVIAGKRGKFILRWKQGRKWKERTTDISTASKRNRMEALQLAAQLEQELAGDAPPALLLTKHDRKKAEFNPLEPELPDGCDGNWKAFKTYFEDNHLASLSKSYHETMMPVLKRYEEFAKPGHVTDVKASTLRRWFATMIGEGLSKSTIKTYWAHLRAFLAVAEQDGLIDSIPRVRLPKVDSKSLAKGRALTLEEFERLIAAVQKVTAVDENDFKYFLWGMWLAGLRISEAYRLAWSDFEDSGIYVDLDRKRPMFVITKQKNQKRQLLPMTPDFVEHLRKTKPIKRHGYVYGLSRSSGGRLTQDRAERYVSKCGEKANIITGKKRNGDNKCASAQDLRRSFATRLLEKKYSPQLVQQLLRHATYATTEKYYAQINADALADQMYENEGLGGQKGGQTPKRRSPAKNRKRS